ncbi:hypothetical protein ACFQS7_05990 [Dankookia sp. GCM10030260]|uniref:hypothetical protein n=1 Tax=Dankookia sp. GCM10030260 TaxID=3273390 RepID=UPI003620EE8C
MEREPKLRFAPEAGGRGAFAPELAPEVAHAAEADVRLVNPPDRGAERGVTAAPGRALGWIHPNGSTGMPGRRGDPQHPADRLAPVGCAVIVDERDHGFDRRSSSATAKYADALRGISLACRRSRTSRSCVLIRLRSPLVRPGRCLSSRPVWRTRFLGISVVQPILPAVDPIAAQRDAWSPP